MTVVHFPLFCKETVLQLPLLKSSNLPQYISITLALLYIFSTMYNKKSMPEPIYDSEESPETSKQNE